MSVTDSLEREIHELRALYWSERDPEGRGFAPLADAYRRAGNLTDALELLRDGLDRHPDFASGHVVAARTHLARGDADAAMLSLETVLTLDEENTEALSGLGDLHQEQGSLNKALALFQRLSVAVPGDDGVMDRVRSLKDLVEGAAHSEAEPMGESDPEIVAEEAAVEELTIVSEEGAVEDLSIGATEGVHEDPGIVATEATLEDLGVVADDGALPQPGITEAEPAPQDADLVEGEGGPQEPDFVEEEDDFQPVTFDTGSPFGSLAGEPETEPVTLDELASVVDAHAAPVEEALQAAGLDESVGEMDWHVPDETLLLEELAEEELFTQTLGELYADQGLTQRAIEVYRHLVEADPTDIELQSRLAELEGLPPPVSPHTENAVETEPLEHLEQDPHPPLPAEADLDALAEDMVQAPEDADGLDTPFAWPGTESGDQVAEDGPSIGDQLAQLLAWTPSGAVPACLPIETLAPESDETAAQSAPGADAGPVVPIESLAPDEKGEGGSTGKVAEFQDWMKRFQK